MLDEVTVTAAKPQPSSSGMSLLQGIGSLLGGSGKESPAVGSSKGSGMLAYDGQNSSSISTPVNTTAGGGFGTQNFNLGSLGIGTSGGFGTGGNSVPSWVWYVAAGVGVLFALKALRK